jgi:hypothetical protein
MAITPRRATVTAETTTEFVIEVPLIVQGVNVKTEIDAIKQLLLNIQNQLVVLQAKTAALP